MNYKKGFAIPFVIAIVGILAISGGVYLVLKNNKKAVTITTEATSSSWETFISKSGWSIARPTTWTAYSCDQCPDVTASGNFVSFSGGVGNPTVTITPFSDKPANTTIDQWLDQQSPMGWKSPVISKNRFTVNGAPAITIVSGRADEAKQETTYISNGIKTVTVATSRDENTAGYNIYKRMLSSFKFIQLTKSATLPAIISIPIPTPPGWHEERKNLPDSGIPFLISHLTSTDRTLYIETYVDEKFYTGELIFAKYPTLAIIKSEMEAKANPDGTWNEIKSQFAEITEAKSDTVVGNIPALFYKRVDPIGAGVETFGFLVITKDLQGRERLYNFIYDGSDRTREFIRTGIWNASLPAEPRTHYPNGYCC